MKISNTNNIHNQKLNILILGESGSGKTTLLSTIPVNTLVISGEAGLLSLKNKNMDYIDITTDDEGKSIPSEKRFERLGEAFKFLQTKEAQETYKAVAIDSLTEVNQCLIDALRIQYPSKTDTLKLYGENAEKMVALIKAFRDLPHYHCVVICQAKTEKDENGRRYHSPDLVGKSSEKIVYQFDEVLYLGVVQEDDGTKKRVLITDKTEKVVAKDRSSKLDLVEKADLSIVMNKILN